jgi:7-keto-8-aminopelargonate synthetase-like enzyme
VGHRVRALDQSAPLEAAGQVRGTFDYMAPEQVQGAPLDARADLYGLGCTLFEGLIERKFRVLGGQHPLLIVEVGPYEILRETINHLYDRGIYCHGLCYPVVPEGEARIRLMVSALHSAEHIQQTLKAFESTREIAAFAVDALDALGKLE